MNPNGEMLFFKKRKTLLDTMKVSRKSSERPEVWPNTLTQKIPRNLGKQIVMGKVKRKQKKNCFYNGQGGK